MENRRVRLACGFGEVIGLASLLTDGIRDLNLPDGVACRLVWLVTVEGAIDISALVFVAPESISSILLLRLLPLGAKICNLFPIDLIPLRNLSRKLDDLVTAARTSSLETVTNVWAWGSVLASQAEGSAMPRRVKGCFWIGSAEAPITITNSSPLTLACSSKIRFVGLFSKRRLNRSRASFPSGLSTLNPSRPIVGGTS
jgi:hypothetical protein